MDQLRYPIGRYEFEGMTTQQCERWISEIERLPAKLKAALEGMDDSQLDTPYRKGGWTVRQVVHHIADAAMNSFARFKLALTENNPTIKPFDESKWAETADSLNTSPTLSIVIIEGLYERFAVLLRSLDRSDFEKQFYHPEVGSQFALAYFLGFVAWHGNHHVAHIASLKERMGW